LNKFESLSLAFPISIAKWRAIIQVTAFDRYENIKEFLLVTLQVQFDAMGKYSMYQMMVPPQ
jgi:hypothetical protein